MSETRAEVKPLRELDLMMVTG